MKVEVRPSHFTSDFPSFLPVSHLLVAARIFFSRRVC